MNVVLQKVSCKSYYSGKTTLLQVLSDGTPVETAPTIGLNVKMVKRGGVQMKCWYVNS